LDFWRSFGFEVRLENPRLRGSEFQIYATGGKMRMRWGVADSPLETTGGFGHCLIERSLMQV
jgi:hypothetical protein